MKTKRLVFCLLLSVMVVVTFIPTIAFGAAEEPDTEVVAQGDGDESGDEQSLAEIVFDGVDEDQNLSSDEVPVSFAATDVNSGLYDSVPWRVTDEYELIIGEEGATYTYDNNEEREIPDYPWDTLRTSIKKVSVAGKVYGRGSFEGFFYNMSSAETIDVSGLDTTGITDMRNMFCKCSSVRTLDVSGFDTSNVTNMYGLFNECVSLDIVDVSKFDTSNVTNMGYMFFLCKYLGEIDVSGFETSKVTYMDNMFAACLSIDDLNLSNFDTHNVYSMSGMFCNCEDLTRLDVSNFNTQNVRFMVDMFAELPVTSLDLSSFDTRSLTSMDCMFENCYNLENLDLSNFNIENVDSMSYMFSGCSSLRSLDLSSFDTTNVNYMEGMFDDCDSLELFKVGKWSYEGVKEEESDYLKHVPTFPVAMCDSVSQTEYSAGSPIPSANDITYVKTNGTPFVEPDEPIAQRYKIAVDTWDFRNTATGKLELSEWKQIMSDTWAKFFYKKYKNGFGGTCYGFSLLIPAILDNGFPFELNKKHIHDYSYSDVKQWLNLGMMYQCLPKSQITYKLHKGYLHLDSLAEALQEEFYKNGPALVISVDDHEILPIAIAQDTENELIIDVYDSNYPDNIAEGQIVYPSIKLYKDGMYYKAEYGLCVNRGGAYATADGQEACIDVTHSISYETPADDFESAYVSAHGGGHGFRSSANYTLISSSSDTIGTASELTKIGVKNGDENAVENDLYWAEEIDGNYTVTDAKAGKELSFASPTKSITIIPSTDTDIEVNILDDAENVVVNLNGEEDGETKLQYLEKMNDMQMVETVATVSGGKNETITIGAEDYSVEGVSGYTVVTSVGQLDDEAELTGTSFFKDEKDELDQNQKYSVAIPIDDVLIKSLADCTIKLSATSFTYNGKAQKPTARVWFGDIALEETTDYQLEYKNNTNAGTASVIITGIGSCTGTVTKTFTIKKATQKMTVKAATKTLKANKLKKKAQTVTAITVARQGTAPTYKKLSGSGKLTVNAKTGKITVKKKTKKGTYRVKVRVTSGATTNYNAAYRDVLVTVKVKK